MDQSSFAALGVSGSVLAALERKGFEEPTPIQRMAIPRLLQGTGSVVAKARTGTGKTAAFGIPLVQLLDGPAPKPRALVLVPTRELALQVCGEIMTFATGTYPRITPIYGGSAYGEQFRKLKNGVDIVVGTPGRVLDHIDRGSLDLSDLQFFVLDEGDEMLDMGFLEDIEKVFEKANPERRVLIFSATMPQEILRVAKNKVGTYETLIDESVEDKTLTEQIWIEVNEGDKLEALRRIVEMEDDFYGIVFCATKVDTDELARKLNQSGIETEPIHGHLSQGEREKVLKRFRDKQIKILTATDVAARGIDVDKISHVINFSLPHDADAYTHRIGRTGRAGNTGVAITFVTPSEYRRLFWIQKRQGDDLKKGAIPGLDEVIGVKRDRILEQVKKDAEIRISKTQDDAESGNQDPWLALADDLLEAHDPRIALASALEAGFRGELDRDKYGEIRTPAKGQSFIARLYVGMGRKDNVTKKDIAELIADLAGLPARLVNGVELYENCSFVNIPFDAAERAMDASRKRGGMPSIKKASPRKEDGGARHASGPGSYERKREGGPSPRPRPEGGYERKRPTGDRVVPQRGKPDSGYVTKKRVPGVDYVKKADRPDSGKPYKGKPDGGKKPGPKKKD